MKHEADRLAFVEARDGKIEARDFARRTLSIYRAAVKRRRDGRRRPYGSAYRRVLIEPCLDFRDYLRADVKSSAEY